MDDAIIKGFNSLDVYVHDIKSLGRNGFHSVDFRKWHV